MKEENKLEIINMFSELLKELDFNERLNKHIDYCKENFKKNGMNHKLMVEIISELSYSVHIIVYHLSCMYANKIFDKEDIKDINYSKLLSIPYWKLCESYLNFYIKTNPFYTDNDSNKKNINDNIEYLLKELSSILLNKIKEFTDSIKNNV